MTSLWTDTAAMPSFPRLRGELKTDVLVIGGGLTGLLTAYLLHQEGVDCALVEAASLCGGASGHTTAKLTVQHGLIYAKLMKRFGAEKAALYLQANRQALDKYRELAAAVDCDFDAADFYLYSLDDRPALERELRALDMIGAAAEYCERPALPFATAGAVRLAGQAQFHPLKFAAALARGLNIYEHSGVHSLRGTVARTERGRIEAERIVVATHFPIIDRRGAYFAKLYQQRSYALAVGRVPPLNAMYADAAGSSPALRSYGELLLISGGGARTGKTRGGWRELQNFARVYYPAARERYRWATQDCISLDGLPYIGRYAAYGGNWYVAGGFNKWGMTQAMAAAQLLTALIRGRETPYRELFSPARGLLKPQLAVNGAETLVNLLSFSRPRCTHLGCALQWNEEEQSWDCPCHGSRFDREGTLINDPATRGLKDGAVRAEH